MISIQVHLQVGIYNHANYWPWKFVLLRYKEHFFDARLLHMDNFLQALKKHSAGFIGLVVPMFVIKTCVHHLTKGLSPETSVLCFLFFYKCFTFFLHRFRIAYAELF